MTELLGTLAWCVTVGLCVWRGERIVRDWWALRAAERAPATPATDDPVPDDLLALAMSYPEQYQPDVLAAIREKHGLTNDWNAVRRGFGVGVME